VHFLDLGVILLILVLWLLPGALVLRDARRRPPAGRALGRRCALFGLPGALVYFGLLRIHERLQAQKRQRLLRS
jgi:O-antigen ligase